MHADAITKALIILRSGGIIAMPTDTVYGLHCDPHDLEAVKKIIALKKRSAHKGLILVADSLERFHEYIRPLPESIDEKIRSHPGITWLVPAANNISPLITGDFTTIAIRIVTYPLIAQLSELLNSPLVSTSANISFQSVATNIQEIKNQFPKGIDLIIEGDTRSAAKASEIRDAFTDEVLR